MATGTNGFGLTHGYMDQDAQPDRDNSHEYKGHGVSNAWIQQRVRSAHINGTPAQKMTRLAKFGNKMRKVTRTSNSPLTGDKARVAASAADKRTERIMQKKRTQR